MKHRRNTYCIFLLVLFAGFAIAQDLQNINLTNNVVHSKSNTSNWQIQTTGFASDSVYAISVIDKNVCWMAGRSGRIIRTLNGGNNWSPVNSGIINTQDIHVFEGVNDAIAFAGTTASDTAYIYRTTNSGSSWTKVFTQYGGSIFGIKMFNTNKGIALGNPVGGLWTMLNTTNSGETWDRIPSEPPQVGDGSGGRGFGTFDTNYVWFFDNNGRWYISSQGGNTWSYSEPSSGTSLLCINSPDLWLLISNGTVTRWSRFLGWSIAGYLPSLSRPPTGFVGALWTNEFWIVQDEIFYTSNAWSTWTAEPPNALDKSVKLIDMVTIGSEVSAWATGIGDTVYRYHRNLTSVNEHPQPIPNDFSLTQNYPNPFNPITIIKYQLPVSNWVTLKVYNTFGQEVATLVNELKHAGSYDVTWNADGFPSGVYLYRLSAGTYSETKKLILLK